MRTSHFGNRAQVLAEQGQLVVQSVQELPELYPDLSPALNALVELITMLEKDAGLTKLYAAWERRSNMALAAEANMGWPREVHHRIVAAMVEYLSRAAGSLGRDCSNVAACTCRRMARRARASCCCLSLARSSRFRLAW